MRAMDCPFNPSTSLLHLIFSRGKLLHGFLEIAEDFPNQILRSLTLTVLSSLAPPTNVQARFLAGNDLRIGKSAKNGGFLTTLPVRRVVGPNKIDQML